jgi:hypothetical protein
VKSLVLEMEDSVIAAPRLATACEVFALCGINKPEGLDSDECEALLEIAQDLRHEISKIALDKGTRSNDQIALVGG